MSDVVTRSETLEAAASALYRSRDLDEHRTAARVYHRAQQERLGRPRAVTDPEVRVRVDPEIPQLAWCCRIRGRAHDFTVGRGVERGDDHIFEGVWDGPFAEGRFDRTDLAFGSGARFGPDGVVFVPPKHCWDHLYVLHDRKRRVTLVSNSLNFVLAQVGVRIPGRFFSQIAAVLRTSTDEATALGVDRYDPLVVSNDRYTFHRMMFTNFSVTGTGRFRLHHTLPDELFSTFAEYRTFLLETLRRLADNGADPAREATLRPIVPISNGYDSASVGALAAQLGHRDAVTISVVVRGKDDSGLEVGRQLGLRVDRVPHVLGDELPRLATSFEGELAEQVAEFVATAGLGDDVMLLPLEGHLRGRILLGGGLGDSIWRRGSKQPPGLSVRIPYAKSSTEFRLRVGYAYVPVPAIGARFPWPIKRIASGEDMEPYTLRRPYDRPIARRIAEEAGAVRGTFAVAKRATNPTVLNHGELFAPSVARIMSRYPSAARSGRP